MKRSHRQAPEPEHTQTELVPMEEGPVEALLALGFPSDRMYLVSATEHYYAFTHVGNEMKLREDRFPERAPTDADRASRRKKDLWIEKAAVMDFRLTMKHCVSTTLPNNALLKLVLRGGKRYTMILCMEEDRRTYLEFFRDVANRRNPKASEKDRAAEARAGEREARRLAQEKRKKENEAALAKERTPKGCRWAAAACWSLCAADIVIFYLIAAVRRWLRFPGLLVCMGLEAAALYLVWRWPMYFSLADKDSLRTKLTNRRNNMLLQIVLPLSNLFLLTIGPERYNDIPALIWICLAAVALMIWGVLRLVRKYLLPKGERIALAVLFLMLGAGLPMSLNLILSPESPRDTRTAIIEEMRVEESKYSIDYRLTVKIGSEEQEYDISRAYYDTLQVGDPVTVGFWDGGLGISYTRVVEPNR